MKKALLLPFFTLLAAGLAAQDAVREYKVENLVSGAIAEKFKQLNPTVAVFDQPETNRIILKGPEADVDLAVQSLGLLDVEQKDVSIEFMLVEYHHGTDFDWSLDLTQAQFGRFSNIRLTTGALNGFEFAYNAISHLSPAFKFNLSALASENKAKIITNPHLVARAGSDASLKITENIQVKLAEVNQNSGIVLQRLQEVSAGISLDMKAVPTSDSIVHLQVRGEVSAFLPFSTEGEFKRAVTNVTTQVDLKDGETLIIGGLILEQTNKIDAGLPGLRHIPVLGYLFKRKKKVTDYIERVIYITPHVFSPRSLARETSLRQYEKTRKPTPLEKDVSQTVETDSELTKLKETKNAFSFRKERRQQRRAERKARRAQPPGGQNN